MKKTILEVLSLFLVAMFLVWLVLIVMFTPERDEFGDYLSANDRTEILFCGGVNKC